jgi:hypothetical protein
MGWPWLLKVRDGSLLALIVWCIVFVRRDPVAVRAGLAALLVSFILATLPVTHTTEVILPATTVGDSLRH